MLLQNKNRRSYIERFTVMLLAALFYRIPCKLFAGTEGSTKAESTSDGVG